MLTLMARLATLKPRLAIASTGGWKPDTVRGNRHQRGYGWEWEKLRKVILDRNPLCKPCLDADRVTPATQVDHIIPKSQGGRDIEVNLQPICSPCHATKTARESCG